MFNIFVIILVLCFVNQSQSSLIWDAFLLSLKNLVKEEDILRLNLSRSCSWQVKALYQQPNIVWKMFDASAKFPYSGIQDTGRVELGNFEQCLAIDYKNDEVKILGKYCYAGLVIPDVTNITNTDLFYKLAICIPNGCSAEDILLIVDHIFPGFPPLFIDQFCSTKVSGWDTSFGTLITMCIFLIIIFLLVVSTVYDFYCLKFEQKPAHPLLLAFSVITNTKNILKVSLKSSPETIQIFSGMRIISVTWIIAAHGMQIFMKQVIPVMNWDYGKSLLYKRYASYLLSANLAVSTFFFISGFLVSFLYFKRKIEHWLVQLKKLPLLYLHRYIRLTAPLLMLYLFILYVYKYLGSGPLWESGTETQIGHCRKYWWSYFLYLQNYVNCNEMCLVHLWYLSADMQLFFFAPIVLIPISILLKSKNGLKLAMFILAGLNIFFVIAYVGIAILFPSTNDSTLYTHSRVQDYFIGIAMGIFMRFTRDDSYFNSINTKFISKGFLNLLIWIIVLSVMFLIVLFYEDAEMWFSYNNKTIYIGFARFTWCVGLCWIVYSCYHGYGGIVNWILCRPLFQVGAKITYSMYLLHILVLAHHGFSNKMKFYMDIYVAFYLFCGYFIISVICAFLWSLAFESPILTIEKYFFRNTRQTGVTFANHVKRTEEAYA
ncbi:nose resistant to fluoxetine protein 6-like [Diorhabda sublineata]|uniref:nose resistant to fluoxetine protein 6-like n=1 Tax=Diorhabda sublineata TaxID=1163346 RepID=UPI0024E1141A|nr:nose resistant to fluoxetine protein 6-like [Diorhabda sublineata]